MVELTQKGSIIEGEVYQYLSVSKPWVGPEVVHPGPELVQPQNIFIRFLVRNFCPKFYFREAIKKLRIL